MNGCLVSTLIDLNVQLIYNVTRCFEHCKGAKHMNNFELRKYEPKDCQEIIDLFCDTVQTINSKDYNKVQIDAWVYGAKNIDKWKQSLSDHYTVVAIKNGIIVGFGDIDNTGYLDRLYVHKDYQNQGIAKAMCDKLEQHNAYNEITTHASITAKPFFEHRGYKLIKKQQVERNGISLVNYVMKKSFY